MKKTLSLFLACVMLFAAMALPASAADVSTYEPPILEDEYAYFANAWVGFTPDGGNWYYISGGAGSINSTMNIKVTVYLQKYRPGSWENLAVWSDEGAFNAAAGGSRYIISSGTYRAKLYAVIYHQDGSFGEDVTLFSNQLVIP